MRIRDSKLKNLIRSIGPHRAQFLRSRIARPAATESRRIRQKVVASNVPFSPVNVAELKRAAANPLDHILIDSIDLEHRRCTP